MKNTNLIFFFIAIFSLHLKVYAQDKPGYIVRYEFQQTVESNVGSFPFTMGYDVLGNVDSSILYTKPFQAGSTEYPDKFYFIDKVWRGVFSNRTTEFPFTQEVPVTGKGTKIILEHECHEYTVKSLNDTTITSIMWVCYDLPNTLMPMAGIQPAPGAILEWSFPSTGVVYKAIRVRPAILKSSVRDALKEQSKSN